ncbi:hypothetical protein FAZ15_14490 [Sphingobacterium olei]|uniref:Uncharacterized protein n=1 Tax=Sphingobacterium olei TaxID=2571155 RepID=A0A4U0NYX4_9SPHI|nr:hypothetical protein [Sphingobacterium olei]TJZ60087.1 hypothetical protein FAZ15_14490 [Sphingobacterium olei]
MKEYYFDADGVQQWQNDLYASSLQAQQAEYNFIAANFPYWIIMRFGLSDDQIDYLNRLDDCFIIDVQWKILFAIDHHLPIRLEKETDAETTTKVAESEDSVKVTEVKNRATQTAEQPADDDEESSGEVSSCSYSTEGEVVIRIYYRKV